MKTDQVTDTQALIEHAMTGRPLAPDIYKRSRSGGGKSLNKFKEFGVREIAADLLRDSREES